MIPTQVRDELDRTRGRKAKRGPIGIAAERQPFVTQSGIEAVAWRVPNRGGLGSTGPGAVLVSLPRIRCLEEVRV